MTKTLTELFPKPKEEELTANAKAAINAMNRAAKKLRHRKKALGQKLVVWEDGKVCIIDP